MFLINSKRDTSKEAALAVVKKSKTAAKQSVPTVRGSGLLAIINQAKTLVEENLGHLKDDYRVIRTEVDLNNYIDVCIKNKVVSIDTETTGTNPLDDDIVGISLYTPNTQAVYIPINHKSYITNERIENQLDAKIVGQALSRLINIVKIIMFNASFDIRVIYNHCGVYLQCDWDTSIASRCMNENEPEKKLKPLHAKYVLKGEQDAFTFSDLFKGITFDLVPIDVGYIYAAHDASITYELYEFQKKYLYYDPACLPSDRNGMNGVSWVFFNLEMPLIDAVVDMENVGVELDLPYSKTLLDKYNALLDAKTNEIYDELAKYDELINEYKKSHINAKIDARINLSSPTQLAILFYDILKIDVVDKEKPRGTGEEILAKINLPIAKLILEYRGIAKLINTYVDKLPKCLSSKDNRLHGSFNQYGADTGRFSSKDPNLQNIPSHNKDIRKMFKATDNYVWLSSDYSQQEPKCLAALCRLDGDSQMYDTFMQGKDLYSEIASKSFNKPYNECLEHFPKDTPIKQINGKWYYATNDDYDKLADGETDVYDDGKERRSQAKSILLGVLYGRGTASIAEQLNCSVEQAQAIKDSVFRGFPAIKKFEQDSIKMSIEKGYVTTICGRKRRLPSMQLPDYEVEWLTKQDATDILDFTNETQQIDVPEETQLYWLNKIYNARGYKARHRVFEEANKQGFYIRDNTKDKDVTKVVNARIQGSAADLTKAAMIELYNNEKLKNLGFRMLIQVHDEIIAECPKETAKEVTELLAQTMSHAAERILEMPIKCDVTVTECWYGEEYKL